MVVGKGSKGWIVKGQGRSKVRSEVVGKGRSTGSSW